MQELLAVARGELPAELRLKGARLLDVFEGRIFESDLFVHQGRIVGFQPRPARETIDLSGLYLLPGFIDAHLHLESSYLTPTELARLLLPCGTTSLICDPHEIANVLGLEGVGYLLAEAKRTPLNFFFTAPSCVPASPLETPGAILSADEVAALLRQPEVLGLAEVMNFPGVVNGEPELLSKIRLAKLLGKAIDGHAPGLSGRALEAYRLAGPASDHECTTRAEAAEKLRLGMHIFIRRGTAANNLPELLPLVRPENFGSFCFCSDDLSPREIQEQGHLNRVLREAVAYGLDPVTAVRLVTLSPARYFGLRQRGALFPGAWADLVAVKDLKNFEVQHVWAGGKWVVREGDFCLGPCSPGPFPCHPVRIPEDLSLRLPVRGKKVRVIGLIPGQILTEALVLEPTVKEGEVVADPARDLAKIACLERHHGTGRYAVGLVQGFGLRSGALASTVAHDSHHLLVVGTNDEDMLLAIRTIQELGGGQVVVEQGRVLAALPLPVGGLLSTLTAQEVIRHLEALRAAAHNLGSPLEDPFMSLSFLALPVIPRLKITDQGLVDVESFSFVDLFCS